MTMTRFTATAPDELLDAARTATVNVSAAARAGIEAALAEAGWRLIDATRDGQAIRFWGTPLKFAADGTVCKTASGFALLDGETLVDVQPDAPTAMAAWADRPFVVEALMQGRAVTPAAPVVAL